MDLVTLTADFGGHYAGIMTGVIKGRAPSADVVGLSREVEPFGVKAGAFILLCSYKYFPKGTIHVAVVDPGVGSSRKAIAIVTKNYIFVGPDNGVLSLAAEEDGVVGVYEITNALPLYGKACSTFHGRDIFAPAAAHLANGGPIEKLGSRLMGFERATFAKSIGRESVSGEVLYIDRFGNLTISITEGDTELGGAMVVTIGGKRFGARRVSTYAEGGEGLSVVLGSAGFYELAVKEGSAEKVTGASVGEKIIIVRS